jgi:hypothetical protein
MTRRWSPGAGVSEGLVDNNPCCHDADSKRTPESLLLAANRESADKIEMDYRGPASTPQSRPQRVILKQKDNYLITGRKMATLI